jgi:ABC-2 type transport system ATP-binding protein
MIEVTELKKFYNGVAVLDIPSLVIANGESFGLVGNNGAGKTTFFRLILDLIEASSGEVRVNGETVARRDEWKSYVGSFLDEGFLIDFLTPEEFFSFTGKVYGKSKEDITVFLESMTEFFNGEILGKRKFIRDLSKGNQKKVGIAAALIGDPQILILDEPFTALDPSSQIRLKRMLNELKATQNMTMLISSHM